ncbi:glycosyltransferase [Bacillus mycoides]|uniref:glycosyltransferase n=1 Tax=Bacillus mycoides TaxID=1405 RepID=UPI000BF9577D|nr:glycosyltransferase [Bacillus mycoides]PFX98201.1 glycosyltransferase [Bacillus mycoides]QWH03517.1 glycosyltransferase [Bacillus mycoides]
MKVVIVGPVPPPMGGISVHIKRVQKYLINKNMECIVYNESKWESPENAVYSIKSFKKFLLKISFIKTDVLHFHTVDKRVRIMLGIYKLFGKKIILTIHGESLIEQITESNVIIRYCLLKSLKSIDKIICVNPKNEEQLLKLGFDEKKVCSIPAFLKPIENKNDFNNIPQCVWEFISNQEFVIAANGNIKFYNNEDLYGVDLLIKLVKKLNENGFDIGLVFAVLGVKKQNDREKKHYEELKRIIKNNNLEDKILLHEVKDTELYPIITKSNLFIRPTNTDGYGVSIAEALILNVPAIASDVCPRPEGTIIFENRNLSELYSTVVEVYSNYAYYKKQASKQSVADNGAEIFKVYQSIVG